MALTLCLSALQVIDKIPWGGGDGLLVAQHGQNFNLHCCWHHCCIASGPLEIAPGHKLNGSVAAFCNKMKTIINLWQTVWHQSMWMKNNLPPGVVEIKIQSINLEWLLSPIDRINGKCCHCQLIVICIISIKKQCCRCCQCTCSCSAMPCLIVAFWSLISLSVQGYCTIAIAVELVFWTDCNFL